MPIHQGAPRSCRKCTAADLLPLQYPTSIPPLERDAFKLKLLQDPVIDDHTSFGAEDDCVSFFGELGDGEEVLGDIGGVMDVAERERGTVGGEEGYSAGAERGDGLVLASECNDFG